MPLVEKLGGERDAPPRAVSIGRFHHLIAFASDWVVGVGTAYAPFSLEILNLKSGDDPLVLKLWVWDDAFDHEVWSLQTAPDGAQIAVFLRSVVGMDHVLVVLDGVPARLPCIPRRATVVSQPGEHVRSMSYSRMGDIIIILFYHESASVPVPSVLQLWCPRSLTALRSIQLDKSGVARLIVAPIWPSVVAACSTKDQQAAGEGVRAKTT